jgi:membrane fusion protein (multidrug efflux system)
VSVEQAELRAAEAHAALAESLLARVRDMTRTRVASDTELDRARAERDVAVARIARAKAVIDRKTIRAPFRARIGMSDVHVGQYLEEGTLLTTLQGVDDAAHVDFTVAQRVAEGLREGDAVEVFVGAGGSGPAIPASIVAIDARVDPNTRNAAVRARIADAASAPAPGASVRVRVPVGEPSQAVALPATALRKGPEGDHVFVITPGQDGRSRAQVRQVRSGPVLGDEVLIYAGVSPGERVAASGSFKLREDALVAVAVAGGGPDPDLHPAE